MDKLNFDENSHSYTLIKDNDEEINLVSVTQLLKKHGLSPDYSNVDSEILRLKAERGKVIHKELEEYINHKQVGFTGEFEAFYEQCICEDILPSKSEFMVWNDEIAGTVDVAGIIKGQTFIGDFKTTSSLHREVVAWQLSLYAYLMNETFDKYICFHFPDDHTCKIVELKPIPREEIERLLDCERNSMLYERKTFEIDTASCEKLITVQSELKALAERKKQLEEQEESLKDFLIQKFEETGLPFIDNDYFKITYIAPTTRESFDTKKLKEELPDIAKQFLKKTPVKAQVRITLKG